MRVPGIGPVTASVIAASVQDVGAFSGPREFAAFLGLAPSDDQAASVLTYIRNAWGASAPAVEASQVAQGRAHASMASGC